MTMTSFAITLCGQCCRCHVVGQLVVSVCDWVCDFSPWSSSAMEAATETKCGTKVACGVRMMTKLRIHAQRREARDTTLDDKKIWRPLHSTTTHRTSVLVTALCNQPKLSLRTSVTTSHVTCKRCRLLFWWGQQSRLYRICQWNWSVK